LPFSLSGNAFISYLTRRPLRCKHVASLQA
jgi:hypothetical protein